MAANGSAGWDTATDDSRRFLSEPTPLADSQ